MRPTHVELAGHVTVLHEAVVETLTAHARAQQLRVVLVGVGGSEEPRVVLSSVHLPSQLGVAHVGVEAARSHLALQLIKIGRGWGQRNPRGLFVEVQAVGGRGGVLKSEKVE